MFKEKAAKLLKLNSELITSSVISEFSVDDLEKAGIHPAFIKYLWAEKVQTSGEESGENLLFKKSEIIIGLKKAAVFNLNFLFNPVFLLKKILFVPGKQIDDSSFEDLKNRVYYFRYYIDILIKLFKSEKLNSESYDETMSKIQKKLFAVNYNSLITDGVDALNHFFNHGEHYSALDSECMKLFLLSRDLKDSYDKLLPNFGDKDQLSIWKIKDVLTGSEVSVFDSKFDITREIRPQTATLPSISREEKPVEENEADSGETSSVVTGENPLLKVESDAPDENSQVELKSDIHTEKKPDFVKTVGSNGETANSKPKMAAVSLEEMITQPKRKIEFEEVEEEIPHPFEIDDDAKKIISTLPSIHDQEIIKVFDDEPIQRYEFSFPPKIDEEMGKIVQRKNLLASLDQDESLKLIQHIFDGDHSDFFSSIETIEKCRTLSEAKKLLSIIFSNAGLSDNNKYARMLADKTERCFTG